MSQFEFGYDDVKQSFQKRAQVERVCLQQGRYERYALGVMEEWLNNYTALLNMWFCEMLYHPSETNLENWQLLLRRKLRDGITMTISEIIERFDLKTIQFDGKEVWGVPELGSHLRQYVGLRTMYKNVDDLTAETLAGHRIPLTTSLFGPICSANSKRLKEELKGKYPLTDEMLVNLADSFSYLNIVQDEEARESKIFDLMIQYEKQIIHPILVELGYVKNDRMNN